jgi:hypothetical protein
VGALNRSRRVSQAQRGRKIFAQWQLLKADPAKIPIKQQNQPETSFPIKESPVGARDAKSPSLISQVLRKAMNCSLGSCGFRATLL